MRVAVRPRNKYQQIPITVERYGGDLQQRMAHEFGADIAATDASRVLRLPGFANRKYEAECLVRVTKNSDKTYNLRDFKIASGPAKGERTVEHEPPRLGGAREALTQSEHDWAFRTKQPVVINSIEEARHDPEIFGTPDGEKFFQALKLEEIRSACNLPLLREDRVIGILTLASRRNSR